jgi:hypothetical protein
LVLIAAAFAAPSVAGAVLAALTVCEVFAVLLSPPELSAAPPHAAKPSDAASMIRYGNLFLFMTFFESPYV